MIESLQLPDAANRLDSALAQLRKGGAVIIRDCETRENEGDLAFSARLSTPELLNFVLHHGRGLLCVSMSEADAWRIGVERLKANGKDEMGTPFGTTVSALGHGSGVSAASRAATLRAVADSRTQSSDFALPGHVATLIAHPGGVLSRNGHTEAVLELLSLAGIPGPGGLCEILSSSGAIATGVELEALAARFDLPMIDIADIVAAVERSSLPG